MSTAGTEKTLTVDANVFNYYCQWTVSCSLPQDLQVLKIKDFCSCVLKSYPIAMNKFIRDEYARLVSLKFFGLWYKTQLSQGLVIEVKGRVLSNNIKAALRDNYKFNCRSRRHGRDKKYLETCLNTILKFLVTEDSDFFLPHKSRKPGRSMDRFLNKKLGISVAGIDRCCDKLLREPGE